MESKPHDETQTARGNEVSAREIMITIKTDSYDARSYGFPWIARVEFRSESGDFEWGRFSRKTPDHGGMGTLSIKANIGDIIAHGQKGRGFNPRCIQYSVVTSEGTLQVLPDKDEARRYWKENHATLPNGEAEQPADTAVGD